LGKTVLTIVACSCLLIWLLGQVGPLILSKPVRQAPSPHLVYTPEKCSTDAKGFVYFALGRDVIHQPAANLISFGGVRPSDPGALLKPPKPNDQLGCPDHPIQGAYFELHRVSVTDGSRESSPADAISLTINSSDQTFGKDDIYKLLCISYKLPVAGYSGLSGCKKPFHCGEDAAFQAIKYTTPVGEPVSFFCQVSLGCNNQLGQCDGAYQLKPRFQLYFSFSAAVLPLGNFVEADKIVRQRLSDSTDTEYAWNETSR
jgi:hypothetical protein